MKRIISLSAFLLLAFFLFAGSAECNHKWTDYTVLQQPTCTQTGLETRSCTLCGEKETEILAQADHTYGEWKVYGDNAHVRNCSVCQSMQKQEHDRSISKNITMAESAKLGKRDYTCSLCGYSFRRYVSAYDNLFEMNGEDILNNGTSYIKVNTISLTAGGEKVLKLHTDAEITFYASTNSKLLIYANATTGEYTGLSLVSGDAILYIKGNAQLEFVSAEPQTKLAIGLEGNGDSVTLRNRIGSQTTFHASDGMTVYTHIVNTSGSISIYPSNKVQLDGNGKDSRIVNTDVIAYAEWTFDPTTELLKCKEDSCIVRVMDVDNRTLLYGSSEGVLEQEQAQNGWYLCVISDELTCFSPVFSHEGEILRAAVEPVSENNRSEETSKNKNTPSNDLPPVEFSYESSYSETFRGTPQVEISFSKGIYSVRVTAIPDNCTFDHIELVQDYCYGGFIMTNRYTASADFEIKNIPGSITAKVYLLDNDGEYKVFSAGSFLYE